ncbi:MAG: hypothetical protein HGA43_08640 [Nitrospirae bacterium]|nr:hypothetical protein [Nitrospirota bacterium]
MRIHRRRISKRRGVPQLVDLAMRDRQQDPLHDLTEFRQQYFTGWYASGQVKGTCYPMKEVTRRPNMPG